MANTITKKRVSPATIAIIILSVLLVASITLGATLAYFSATQDVTGTITLGDPVNINITQGGAAVSALTFTGDAMPGSVYSQPIGVSIPQDTSDALIRAKLTLTNAGGASTNVVAATASTWLKGEDDYYYYQGVAVSGQKMDFVNSVTIPTSLTNEDANKIFTVTVVVEAIQEANYAAADVWTTAPDSWIATYATAPAG